MDSPISKHAFFKFNKHADIRAGVAIIALISPPCFADHGIVTTPNEWHTTVHTEVNYWRLSGTIENQVDLDSDNYGAFFATSESLNVQKETIPAISASAKYNRWTAGLYYLPIEFSGVGTAKGEIDLTVGDTQIGAFANVPLASRFDLHVALGKFSYDLISASDRVFGIGFGLGQLDIDIDLDSPQLTGLKYTESDPFGFLNIHMANRQGRFFYGFSLNAIKVELGGINESYSDYKIDFGYRILEGNLLCDLTFGYRHIEVNMDIDSQQETTKINLGVKGPALGLSVHF